MNPTTRIPTEDQPPTRRRRWVVPATVAAACVPAAAAVGGTGIVGAISFNHNETDLRAPTPRTAARRPSSVDRAAVALMSDPRQRRRLRDDRGAFAAAFDLDDAELSAVESGDGHALASVGVDVASLVRRQARPRRRLTRALAAVGISVTMVGSTLGLRAWGFGRMSPRTHDGTRAARYLPSSGYDDDDYGSETGSYRPRDYAAAPLAGEPFSFPAV